MPLSSHVSTASGQKMLVAEGTRLVFGRGPGVDLIIAAGRGLSRRAGLVTVMAAGVWIANISRTHALYVEGEGYQVRLPRMERDGEPANGWFVHAGTALVGSRAMLDEGQSLMVTVTGQYDGPAAGDRAGWAEDTELAATGLTGGRLANTGLADEGEWTDEVFAAGPAGQADLESQGTPSRGTPGRVTLGQVTPGQVMRVTEGRATPGRSLQPSMTEPASRTGRVTLGQVTPGQVMRVTEGRATPGRSLQPSMTEPASRTGPAWGPGTGTGRCCRSTWTR